MKNTIDFTNIVMRYKGLWVTLDEKMETVITSGKTAKSAYDEAIKLGFTKPTLFKVPQDNVPYIGLLE